MSTLWDLRTVKSRLKAEGRMRQGLKVGGYGRIKVCILLDCPLWDPAEADTTMEFGMQDIY